MLSSKDAKSKGMQKLMVMLLKPRRNTEKKFPHIIKKTFLWFVVALDRNKICQTCYAADKTQNMATQIFSTKKGFRLK